MRRNASHDREQQAGHSNQAGYNTHAPEHKLLELVEHRNRAHILARVRNVSGLVAALNRGFTADLPGPRVGQEDIMDAVAKRNAWSSVLQGRKIKLPEGIRLADGKCKHSEDSGDQEIAEIRAEGGGQR